MDLKDFNFVGWILILVTIAVSLGAGLPVMFMISESLPEGRYPRIVYMAPMLNIAAIVFFVGWGVLAMCGIKIKRAQ